jgi:methionyl-tRNA formyltransferase
MPLSTRVEGSPPEKAGSFRLAVFGYRTIGCACLEVLLEAQAAVVGVVTAPDSAADPETAGGFYRSMTELARERSLRCLTPGKVPWDVNAPDVIASIRSLGPLAFFLFDYPQHVGPELLALPERGAINLYATRLPDFPGYDPALRAVMQGATTTGVTLHDIAPATAGLIAQRTVPIGWTDSSHDVYLKQVDAAAGLLREKLPELLSGQAARTPMPPASSPPFGPLRPEECVIDWNRPAVELYNLIRAVSRPYPGALAAFRGRRCRIWKSDVRPAQLTGRKAAPGRILKLVPFQVDTGDGMLRPRELQLEGEAPLSYEAFLEQYQVAAGESFAIGQL